MVCKGMRNAAGISLLMDRVYIVDYIPESGLRHTNNQWGENVIGTYDFIIMMGTVALALFPYIWKGCGHHPEYLQYTEYSQQWQFLFFQQLPQLGK